MKTKKARCPELFVDGYLLLYLPTPDWSRCINPGSESTRHHRELRDNDSLFPQK
jgi:hypothetical protein